VNNRAIGIAGGVIALLGYLVADTSFFTGFTWDGSGDLSPAATHGLCMSAIGQLDSSVNAVSAGACSSAATLSTIGEILIFVGAVLIGFAVVRALRNRARG
jgi:hypothetical protein